jgi:hypothetical protein
MGERDETPNHKEVLLNFIPPENAKPCAGEPVDVRGQLKLGFGFEKILGERVFMPVHRDLAKGQGQIDCPNSGECWVGVGKTTGHRYTADRRIGVEGVNTHRVNGDKFNTCRMYLIITGEAPGRQVRFRLFYTVEYGFDEDHRVTFCRAIPSVRPLCKGLF